MSPMTILLTRPLHQSRPFAKQLDAALPTPPIVLHAPMTRIVPETGDFSTDDLQGLLFTSANAVNIFAERCPRRDIPALCVGDRTAEVAIGHGFSTESARGDVSALANLAVQSNLPGAGAFLHLRGRQTAGDLAAALACEGIMVRESVLYDAAPVWDQPADVIIALERGVIDVALFFSPRASRIFVTLAQTAARKGRGWALGSMKTIAISSAAAQPLRELEISDVRVATSPDADSIMEKLQDIQ